MKKNPVLFAILIVLLIIIFDILLTNKNLYFKVLMRSTYGFMYGKNTNEFLKKIIALDYPQIDNKNIDDLEKTNLLRQWVAENVPWGSQSVQIKKFIKNKEPPEIYNILQKKIREDIGGVDCSGFAYTLMKIYKIYGYESYAYHYGNLNGWNDVVTLVRIDYQGKNLLIIQQSLLDAIFIDKKTKTPLDFFDFLSKIKNGKTNDVFIQQGYAKPHISFCAKQDSCKVSDDAKVTKLINNKIKYLEKYSTYTLQNNLNSFLYARDIQTSDDNDIDGKKQLLDKINNFISND